MSYWTEIVFIWSKTKFLLDMYKKITTRTNNQTQNIIFLDENYNIYSKLTKIKDNNLKFVFIILQYMVYMWMSRVLNI